MATITRTNRDPFCLARDRLREAVATFNTSVPPAVSQAMQSLLAALEYEDRPLIRSHIETAVAALVEAVGDVVNTRLNWSQSIRRDYRRAAAEVGAIPSEEFDGIGRGVSDELDKIIAALTDLREGSVREMKRAGVEVPGGQALEAEIQEMESFKASLIGGWPWSHLPVPASDAAMLARARAGTQRGEGVPIEDLIRDIEAGH